MWLFKRPLSEWQRTQLVWNHQFVVIDLPGWYWSLEREGETPLLQRNVKYTVVKDYEDILETNNQEFHSFVHFKTNL